MDPRLRFTPVAAPDLSGASRILAGANQSFNAGLGGAQEALARYGAAQTERADNELLSELSAIGSEEEFDNFVDSGGLAGRNISQALRDRVLSQRSNLVQQESTRSATRARNAAAGRAAASAAATRSRQEELNNLSGLIVAARQEGNEFGTTENTAFNALQEAVANSSTLGPGDIDSLLGSARSVRGAGQGRLDETREDGIARLADQAVLDSLTNPNVTNDPSSLLAAASEVNLSPSDTLNLFGRLQGAAEANPSIFNPQAPADPLLEAQLASNQRIQARENAADPTTVLLNREAEFRDDPTGSVISELEIFSDGEDSNTALFGLIGERQDRQTLDRYIREGAERNGVTQSAFAAAMVETFRRDPAGTNTNDRRFNTQELDRFVQDNLSTEAIRRSEDTRIQQDVRNAELGQAQNDLSTLQSQALRFESLGQPVPAQIQRDIDRLSSTLTAGYTPQQAVSELQAYIGRTGTASRLEGLDPGSTEYFRAISDLQTQIQSDPSLSAAQKRVLLSTLNG